MNDENLIIHLGIHSITIIALCGIISITLIVIIQGVL